MKRIYIPQLLQAPAQTEEIVLDEPIPGLEALTPTRGNIKVVHCGTYLQVTGKAEMIVTLVCDRCLQNYNHRLGVDTSELIWLNQPDEGVELGWKEKELSYSDDLSESLPLNGYFEPMNWIYEQLSLAMPVRQLCGNDCQPPAYQTTDPDALVDSRWSRLAALKHNWQEK